LNTHNDQFDDYRWLTGPEAAEILGRLADADPNSLLAATRLRKIVSPARAHLILEQIRLRSRATGKFEQAARQFFTPTGLQQSTGRPIARYKADWIAKNGGPVADLCCGLGGDLIALAEKTTAVGVERDPVVAHLAATNLEEADRCQNNSQVVTVDVDSFSLDRFAAWHIDPDRRPEGHRTTQLDLLSPGPEVIRRLLKECPNGVIKLAPATELPHQWFATAQREWISHDRECRQQLVRFGCFAAHPGQSQATIVNKQYNGPQDSHTFIGQSELDIPTDERIDQYMFEPDPSILAARLTGALAEKFDLHAPTRSVAYLSGPEPIDERLLSCYLVRKQLPLHLKQLKARLRQLEIGQVEVKKRGLKIDPNRWEKQLKTKATGRAVLICFEFQGKAIAVLADRIVR
jgi:THUMP domain-like